MISCLFFVACAIFFVTGWEFDLPPRDSPAAFGLHTGPLKKLRRELREKVDKRDLPGYAFCVTCEQKTICHDCYGLRDFERGTKVDVNTLFRQFSMTKAIVSVALMTFFDEGQVDLDDDICKFLGEAWRPSKEGTPDGAAGLRVMMGDGVLIGAAGETEEHQTIHSGDQIYLRASRTGKHVDISPEGDGRCRWDDNGSWQAFVIKLFESKVVNMHRVALQAHTGKFVGVSGKRVVANSTTPTVWLIKSSSPAVDKLQLRAGYTVQLQHEETSRWLRVKSPKDDEDNSLSLTRDTTAAAEFRLEKQIWEVPTVPAERPITIRQLLTHTSGLDYAGLTEEISSPLDELVRKVVERCEGGEILSLADWVAEIAKMPLRFQPGTRHEYGYSIDVLGRVVEVLGNKSLDQILHDRIFEPLRMGSTSFATSETTAQHRLAALYQIEATGPDSFSCKLMDDPLSSLWVPPQGPAPIRSAGGGVETLRGGLLSTVPDYMRFCHMLQGGGELDGVRILHESTVKLMTEVNHLDQMGVEGPGGTGKIDENYGWGLLGSIELPDPKLHNRPSANAGNYGWGGWASTYFRIYPAVGLTYVFMTNCIDVNFENLIKRRLRQALRGRRQRPQWRAFLSKLR